MAADAPFGYLMYCDVHQVGKWAATVEAAQELQLVHRADCRHGHVMRIDAVTELQ